MRNAILQVIGGLIIVITATFGAVNYFATASEVQMVATRLDQKIMSDRINQIRQMMWMLEDRNGGSDCSQWINQNDRNQYRSLQMQLEELIERFKIMLKQVKK